MRDLLKKQIDWLWSAINTKPKLKFISIQSDFAIATDGIRIHTINSDNIPDKVDGVGVGKSLEQFKNGSEVVKFHINPKFLIDALRGFDDCITITLISYNDKQGIAINTGNTNNEAFIMCMRINDTI